MSKVFRFCLFDLLRNRWILSYGLLFFAIAISLFALSHNFTQTTLSLTKIILVLAPLMSLLFGITYYYNSRDFIELLLSQPISRIHIFGGLYLALSTTLGISMIMGMALPLISYGILSSSSSSGFFLLCFLGLFLSLVFSLIAFIIGIIHDDKIKGFGWAIFFWIFMVLIYDGIFLLLLLKFKEYPLEMLSLGMTACNPIDLTRILISLQLEMSAMLGYTGAVFEKTFGSTWGIALICGVLLAWLVLPWIILKNLIRKKDF